MQIVSTSDVAEPNVANIATRDNQVDVCALVSAGMQVEEKDLMRAIMHFLNPSRRDVYDRVVHRTITIA